MLENKNTICYKAVIAYDGSLYAGWQVQKNQKSVANAIENTFFRVFNRTIRLTGASRTDAGVHAYGQVAVFTTTVNIEVQKMMWALNNGLPPSIRIRSLAIVDHAFHPRFHVKQKIYWYYFSTKEVLPWMNSYVHHQSGQFSLDLFKECLNVFVGTHDFRSYCTGTEALSTIRTIDAIECSFDTAVGAYKIVFKAQGFLRYLIRRIVGACLYVTQKQLSPRLLQQILEEKNPHQQLYTAPSCGLLLYAILY